MQYKNDNTISPCKTCASYGLYKMITSGKPFGYAGEIPCNTCHHFSFKQDNYTPISEAYNEPKEVLK